MEHTHAESARPGEAAVEQLDERHDDVFEVLSHGHRRFTLVYLSQEDKPVSPRELATSLAESCDETSVEQARISLHHTHLPKLHQAGYVEYDDDDVRLREDAAAPLDLLDCY